jgi:hypothetical protein
MKLKAVTAAEEQLQSAKTCYDNAKNAPNIPSINKEWHHFLIHANQVFSKLEQGAKEGSSKGWFDKIKQIRKTDSLLSYLRHARNAAEHGDTILNNDNVIVGRPAHTTTMHIPGENGETGPPVAVMRMPAQFGLLPVVDTGRTYRPPTEHLGQPVVPAEGEFAKAVFDYLGKLIEEAKTRIGR